MMEQNGANLATQEVYSPVDSYKNQYKQLHHENTVSLFKEMVDKSQIDIAANRETCKKNAENDKKTAGNNKAIKWQTIFRNVVAFFLGVSVITAVYSGYRLITDYVMEVDFIISAVAAVILFIPAIFLFKKFLRKLDELSQIESKLLDVSKELKGEAEKQMRPLNNLLLRKHYSTDLFSKTLPLIQFDKAFDNKRINQMVGKFGYDVKKHEKDINQNTRHIQFGEIKGNPFFLRNFRYHRMGTKDYTGSMVIHWTTREKDSNGNYQTVNHSQTLTATVNKPCPYFSIHSQLVYANEAGDNLSFSREPSHINELRPKQIDREIKKRSKELQKLTEASTKKGGTFTALANNEFDALLYAKDRDNESQFRLLFTPLAQQELSKIIKDNEVGFGDDFSFYKEKKINRIYPEHLNDIVQNLNLGYLTDIDYDKIEKKFIEYHNSYFKHIYFTFAPLLAIPIYTQLQTHEHIYKDLYESNVSFYQHEEAASCLPLKDIAPPEMKTVPMFKTSLLNSDNNTDTVLVNTWGYRTVKRTDYVNMHGRDGNTHAVPVDWDEYIKVSRETKMEVKSVANVDSDDVQASNYNMFSYFKARLQK
nr:hypothetical protein [uncultured Carboxylicivirga sp.]